MVRFYTRDMNVFKILIMKKEWQCYLSQHFNRHFENNILSNFYKACHDTVIQLYPHQAWGPWVTFDHTIIKKSRRHEHYFARGHETMPLYFVNGVFRFVGIPADNRHL